jgi:mitochondrial chaperone BCS1
MKPLTLSGLLNSLDDVISAEGRIIFMTTSFIKRYEEPFSLSSSPNIFSLSLSLSLSLFSLDPALIRPGRVDSKQFIGPLTSYQVEHILTRFYPSASCTDIAGFRRQVEQVTENFSKELSAAQSQGFFMHHKESLGEMREHLGDLARL